ncbi:MAG: MG2 domain-containing protein [Bacteroidia bacterium]|nr:MG2 domain-containing protein [Bacteroidia bacterium]
MNILKAFIPAFLSLFFLFSGCNRNTVKVVDFSPQGEVQPLQTFTVEFSHDLAAAGQMDQWLSEAFIEFEPAIPGKFKWISPKTLLFSPDQPLLPSQTYKATIAKKQILAESKLSGKFDDYEFHTPYFDLTGVDFFWKKIPRSDHKLTVQANLVFAYPVEPSEVSKYLEVTRGGQPVADFQVVSDQPADIIAVNFGEMQQNKENQTFRITVKKGLNSVLNKDPLEDDRSFEKELPGITRLAVTSVSSGFDEEGGWIEVFTTQEVDPDQLAKYLILNPKPAKLNFVVSEDRFRIEGKMEAGSVIDFKVKSGLPGLYGGTLEKDFSENILLADLEPRLRFADKYGTYLLRSGLKNINVEGTNVKKAKMRVYEVFKNNLLFFFYNNYSYGNRFSSYYRDNEYDDATYYDVAYYGKSLYDADINFEEARNKRQSHTINLENALNNRFKGIYVVEVRSEDDYWMQDAKIVAVSDLGIIARQSVNELLVFVNSLKTTEPVSGVNISLISANNQTLVSGLTDAEGIVRFPNLRKDVEDFEPRMLTAELADDFNFVDLMATQVETSRYDVGGKYVPDDSYDVFVYSDRNIFRPGETAHLSAILRTSELETVKDVPISVKVITPTGKNLETYQKKLNEQGSFELGIDIPPFAQTGQYVAELYTGSDKFLSSYRFSVEEFVPDKIRVNLAADKKTLDPGTPLKIEVSSEYLFGAPAAGHKYEMDVRLRHQPYQSKKFPNYDFSAYSNQDSYMDNDFYEGKLDEAGKTTITYNFPAQIQSGGFVKGTAYVSVFDVTGRTVNRSVDFDVYPSKSFIGIRSSGYYFGTNKDISFDLVAVGPEDKQVNNLDVEVELVRMEWRTILEKSNYSGQYQYRSVKKEVSEWKKPLKLSSTPETYTFRSSISGEHELRIYRRGSSDYVKKNFYAYRWGDATASSFEINKEGQVEIILDKKTYKPGEQAKALFVAPFTGKMLITVERDKVLEHFYVDMDKNSKEILIPLNDLYVPNVYITATLFRPHNADDNVPFLVGHGYASVEVTQPSNKLEVTISSPEGRVKPQTTQYITVKAGAGEDVFVTLAAVDEGILQVKNFETPDPYEYMYARRRLSVGSYDLYQYLLPEIVSAKSSPAGGDESESAKRLNPIKSKRFKLVSQWSGIKKTNSNGEVQIPIEIPQYNGEIRLMAVAYQGKRFGSAEKAMKVSDDIILQPSVPRFLTVNDSLVIPVTVMNTTTKAGNVTVKMNIAGTMKISSNSSQSVNVPANGSATAKFVLLTGKETGTGKLTFESSGLDKVKEEIEIGIRPAAPFVVESEWSTLKAGENKTVRISDKFLAGTRTTNLTISSFPAVKFSQHLRYLVGYPHGCLEQTTSQLFPQLYFNELASVVAADLYKRGNPVYYVKEGIKKLEGMQRYDGSFNYWSDGSYYNWWGSVYATHFLVEAEKAGYEVDKTVLTKALDFLAKKAVTKSTFQYVSYNGDQRATLQIADKEIVYSLYVLSLAGQADVSTMNYYRARPELLSGDTKYLLAGAFALNNNYNAYNEILPKNYIAEACARTTGGSFDSEVRANAIMLNVLLDVDPSNKRIPQMVKYLSEMGNKIGSTQDRSWTFLALGKAAGKQSGSDVDVEVLVDGKSVRKITSRSENIPASLLNGKEITLKATGSGETYAFWSTEGVPLSGVKEVDDGMSVRRTYFSRFGNETTTFRQGDLIVAEISLTGGERSVENIAISDLVPAGFEIENPRVSTSADLVWVNEAKDQFTPAYMDVRDDRLLLFTDLPAKKTVRYYYLLRVVNTGTFQLPAIGAEAMYDPAYKSYHGAGVVRVSQ